MIQTGKTINIGLIPAVQQITMVWSKEVENKQWAYPSEQSNKHRTEQSGQGKKHWVDPAGRAINTWLM